ncbi:MAG: choloylglycine hydrolase family protein [Hyphomicrobium sp.]|jgi:choloylglycine hydrolase
MSRKSKLFRVVAASAMFAFASAETASACTGIMLRNADGTIVHGRTVEFGIPLEITYAVVPRNYNFTGLTPLGDGKKWTTKYGVLGAIVFGNLGVMDGINEKGLAMGAFYFSTEAGYTPTTAENQSKSMSTIDFSTWILTQFANVDEVRAAIEGGDAIVAPTLLPGWPQTVQPFHWVVYDKSGKSIAIEPIKGKLVVSDNPLGVFTNSPTFDWHMTNLRNYISLNPRDVPAVTIDDTTFQSFGLGDGMHGLPGDFTPPSRFVRAAIFSATALKAPDAKAGVFSGFHVLNNFDIPYGVSREVDKGVIHADQTIFTTMRDPQNLRVYYKTYDDQTLRMVDMKRFDLDAKDVMRLPDPAAAQSVVDMTGQFIAKKTAANAD